MYEDLTVYNYRRVGYTGDMPEEETQESVPNTPQFVRIHSMVRPTRNAPSAVSGKSAPQV
jgi:hypothetical protein